jgi:ribosomal protein S18 acetylase RimI-like enzyme
VNGARDLARANAFGRTLFERTSTRVETWRFGRAFFHDDFRSRYDSNFVLVERPLDGVAAERLAAEVDRLLEAFPHREIVVEDEGEGAGVAMGLAGLGYRTDRLVVMASRRQPDRESAIEVEELPLDVLRPLHLELLRRDPNSASAAEALAGFLQVLRDGAGARFFAARADGELASCCELYPGAGVAQVENVNTLEEFRGRGLARACVLRAVAEARASGADLVFLHADAGDWPQHLYEKLGFEPVGSRWSFVRLSE